MEDALEYQATWAAFALQSKVLYSPITLALFSCEPILINGACFFRILASPQLLLSVSRRFRTTTYESRQGIRPSCNLLPFYLLYTVECGY